MTQLARRLQAAAAHEFPRFDFAGEARDNSAGSGPVFTFTDMPIGEDRPRRTVAVLIGSSNNVTTRTVSSVRFNGGGNRLRHTQNAESCMAIASTDVGLSGTTADIEVTFSDVMDYGCMIATYALYDLRDDEPTAWAHVPLQGSLTDTISQSIAVPRGGILLAAAATTYDRSANWSGGVTRDMNQSGQRKMSSASRQPGAAETVTPLVTWFNVLGSNAAASMILGVWR